MNSTAIKRLFYTLSLGVLVFSLASCDGGFSINGNLSNGSLSVDTGDLGDGFGGFSGASTTGDAVFYSSYRTNLKNMEYATANIEAEDYGVLESTRMLPLRIPSGKVASLTVRSGNVKSKYLKAVLEGSDKVKFTIIPGVNPEPNLSLRVKINDVVQTIPLRMLPSSSWVNVVTIDVLNESGKKISSGSSSGLTPVEVNVADGVYHDKVAAGGRFKINYGGNNTALDPSNPDIIVESTNKGDFQTQLFKDSSGYSLLVLPSRTGKTTTLTVTSVDDSSRIAVFKVKSVGTGITDGGGDSSGGNSGVIAIKAERSQYLLPQNLKGQEITLPFTVENAPLGTKVRITLAEKNNTKLIDPGYQDTLVPNNVGLVEFKLRINGTSNALRLRSKVDVVAVLLDDNNNPIKNQGSSAQIAATTNLHPVDVISGMTFNLNQYGGLHPASRGNEDCGFDAYAVAVVRYIDRHLKEVELPGIVTSHGLLSTDTLHAYDTFLVESGVYVNPAYGDESNIYVCVRDSKSNPLPAGKNSYRASLTINGFYVALDPADITPVVQIKVDESLFVRVGENATIGVVFGSKYDKSKHFLKVDNLPIRQASIGDGWTPVKDMNGGNIYSGTSQWAYGIGGLLGEGGVRKGNAEYIKIRAKLTDPGGTKGAIRIHVVDKNGKEYFTEEGTNRGSVSVIRTKK